MTPSLSGMGSCKDSSSWDLLDDFNPARSTHAPAPAASSSLTDLEEREIAAGKHDAGVGAT